ncbi:hypothetical protein [Oceanisphaera sp. W20_SRM_FM3]|uniref:hypothetical protein n=1 Tax=Oceanisphaera sp. W20_SRM_FM3 TaxID=3240267 RepID=UPI003F98EE33
MSFPVFPTDSLYKWASIFGLTLIITSGYVFISFLWRYQNSLPEYEASIYLIRIGTLFVAVFGFVLAGWGFYQWYVKLQIHINREVKARADEQEIKCQILKKELESLNK